MFTRTSNNCTCRGRPEITVDFFLAPVPVADESHPAAIGFTNSC